VVQDKPAELTWLSPAILMIEVINRQRRSRIDAEVWRQFTARALNLVGEEGTGVTIAFVSDRGIKDLNRRFRDKNRPTDVLSFPSEQSDFEQQAGKNLGDVVISFDRAVEQSSENGLPLDTEIAQLILHGLLHLKGYDHETDNGEMNRLELELRDGLGI
jgi:probable rRNA maturation factor